jgi:Protein of unknown function (DUF5661)
MNLRALFFPNKTKSSVSPQQAKAVGDKLFVDWKKISPKTLAQGMSIELEHKDTLVSLGVHENDMYKAVARIALDHLAEDGKYYSKLKKLEKK